MAISLASCFLIALFVWDEWQYDRFHPAADRTYRVYNMAGAKDGVQGYFPIVPYPFASYMQKDFPEIESTLRIMDMYGDQLFETGGKKVMQGGGLYAEPTVFDMLTLTVVSGNAHDALIKPNTIALSSSLAKKYFGDKNPIGETIRANNEGYEVTAVFSDPPGNFHLTINYLLSFASTGWQNRFENLGIGILFNKRLKLGLQLIGVRTRLQFQVGKYLLALPVILKTVLPARGCKRK